MTSSLKGELVLLRGSFPHPNPLPLAGEEYLLTRPEGRGRGEGFASMISSSHGFLLPIFEVQ
jgi:hypothetical protein